MNFIKKLFLVLGLKVLEVLALIGAVCIFVLVLMIVVFVGDWFMAVGIIKMIVTCLGISIGLLAFCVWIRVNWAWAGALLEGVPQNDIFE